MSQLPLSFVLSVVIYSVVINFVSGYLLLEVFETAYDVRVSDKFAL